MARLPTGAPVSQASSAIAGSDAHRRLDIQALRALAVLIVVGFHLAPSRMPGGYVGVDVFFVISGFLITGHLARDVARSGRVRFGEFWARRARRLLPASLTVLLCTFVAVVLWAPETQWQSFFRGIQGSAFYIENWFLAADAVDYSASENAATPVQHFWSLSTEEQFYLAWPIVIGITVWLLMRRRKAASARAIAVPLAVLSAASFVFSVWFTHVSPAAAYFSTPARAWEFGLGGVLALASPLAISALVRKVVFGVGVALVLLCTFAFSTSTPFPSYWAALPVAATLVALAAAPDVSAGGLRLLGTKPIQWIGDASYSIYLWHWPLLALWPYAVGSPPSVAGKVAILFATFALAGVSLRFIEDPVRRSAWLIKRRPRVTLGLTALAMVAVAAGPLIGSAVAERDASLSPDVVDRLLAGEDGICYGASAMDPLGSGCRPQSEVGILVPSPVSSQLDRAKACMVGNAAANLHVCEAGVPAEQATETIAVVGDSHAVHWLDAIERIADEQRWHIVTYFKGSCPFTQAVRRTNATNSDSCVEWNRRVVEDLGSRTDITRVFVSASSKNGFVGLDANDEDGLEAGVQGYLAAWSLLPATVQHVYVLRDIPRPRPDVIDCLARLSLSQQLAPGACAQPADEALLVDPEAIAAEGAGPKVTSVDLSDFFCRDGQCLAVIGNAVVYRDGHHMTASYSKSLAPYLWRQIADAP